MFGAYLHVPFCTSRCDYCAFATWTDRAHLIPAYMAACKTQAAALAGPPTDQPGAQSGPLPGSPTDLPGQAAPLPEITSVFVGGGTPNLVPPETVLAVLAELNCSATAEITVECNPDLVSAQQMDEFAAGGINRISLGVQSMAPEVLVALGREHDPAAVQTAVQCVRAAGITQLNLDIIYGAAGETMAQWQETLAQVIALEPDHISAYGLTVEPGTPLADDPGRHPDDDDQAEKYLAADEALAAAGYENYEISNWAKEGSRCRHNLLYWTQGEYIGIGAAAHSHHRGRRWWNVRTPERFIEAIANGESVEAGGERLTETERRVERLQLEIRTTHGVATADVPASLPAEVAELLDEGADGRTRLTKRGRLLANEVAIRLE